MECEKAQQKRSDCVCILKVIAMTRASEGTAACRNVKQTAEHKSQRQEHKRLQTQILFCYEERNSSRNRMRLCQIGCINQKKKTHVG